MMGDFNLNLLKFDKHTETNSFLQLMLSNQQDSPIITNLL